MCFFSFILQYNFIWNSKNLNKIYKLQSTKVKGERVLYVDLQPLGVNDTVQVFPNEYDYSQHSEY